MNRLFLNRLLLLAVTIIASQGGACLFLNVLDITEQEYSNLIINTIFLLGCFGCICLFRLSAEDVGLKILRSRLGSHMRISIAIYTMYWLYYLFVVRISDLRPITSAMMWGLLNYLVVAFGEEIYLRGIFYHAIEQRYSGRAAVLTSGLFFGLLHFRQGMGMLPKFFTGWLWGSVRYSTGMIHLLIFPVHFTYNAVWLLFEGRWDSPSTLMVLFPLVELSVVLLIVGCSKHARGQERSVH